MLVQHNPFDGVYVPIHNREIVFAQTKMKEQIGYNSPDIYFVHPMLEIEK
jgi:hypothetical protein